MPRYGDKTAKKLDNYLQNYTMPTGTTRTGLVAPAVANVIDIGKKTKDLLINKYPLSDSLRDYRANLRGQNGALQKKSLQETCPTHHTKYK